MSVRVGKILVDKLFLERGDRILEIGCSIGTQARELAALGYRVYGLDPDADLIRQFNQLAGDDGLLPASACGLLGDGHALPFVDGQFAAVVCTEVLEHTEHPDRVLLEAWRVLRPAGMVCLSVPTENTERLFARLHPRWSAHSGHIQLFSPDRLLSLVRRAGFSVVETRGECFEWTLFWLFFATLRTPFDCTGTPTAHRLLVRVYWRMWRAVSATRLWHQLQTAGDKRFPKSLYVYARRA